MRKPSLSIGMWLLFGLLTAWGVLTLVDQDGDGRPDAIVIPIPQPGPDVQVQVDADQQREAGEQEESDVGSRQSPGISDPSVETPDVHEDMVDEVPEGISPFQVEAGRARTRQLEEQDGLEPQRPAGAQAYSCPRAHVRNQSALSGPRRGVALHFTVSGPGSLLVIRGLFDRASFGASSNFGIELASRCQEWVPVPRKAWAQGAANSAYVSIEIVTFNLTRQQWLGSAIIRRGVLAGLVADLLKRTGAPPKLVDPRGCVWPAGVTDHDRLECGNTHWDVGKNFPWAKFMEDVRRAYGASGERPLPLRYGRRCREFRHLQRKRASRIKRSVEPTLSPGERSTYRGLRAGFKANRKVACGRDGKAART